MTDGDLGEELQLSESGDVVFFAGGVGNDDDEEHDPYMGCGEAEEEEGGQEGGKGKGADIGPDSGEIVDMKAFRPRTNL